MNLEVEKQRKCTVDLEKIEQAHSAIKEFIPNLCYFAIYMYSLEIIVLASASIISCVLNEWSKRKVRIFL